MTDMYNFTTVYRGYKKTGVSDRLQLAMFAIEKKLFI
jgi:DNA-binding NarL/FixJ family response regulator